MAVSRRRFLHCGSALITSRSLLAQQVPSFSSETRLVNLLATVQDQRGNLRTGLTADDFTVLDDGIPQKIEYFARQSGLPLTVGLLIDASRSLVSQINAERDASRLFIRQLLHENQDRAFVSLFASETLLLQGLTTSLPQLQAAMNQVAKGRYPANFHSGDKDTCLFDAVAASSLKVLKPETGRKALVIFSDGLDNRSKVQLTGAIAAAQQSEVIVLLIWT